MVERLSIIVPVYNEESSIKEAIDFFEKFLEEHSNMEAIFVNDGSTDGTTEILRTISNNRIRVVTHKRNRGYGAAIKTGEREASYDFIAITDCDSSYPSEKIYDLFEKCVAEGADMAVGARVGHLEKSQLIRRFGRFLIRKFAEYLSEETIPDLNSGLRLIRKDLVSKYAKFLPNGFSFTSTITLALLANNYKITYLPIDYYRRKGKSKIHLFGDALNFLQLIIRTVMFFNPLKIFLPISFFFLFLSLGVLITTYFLGRVMDITTILLFFTGLNFLAIGLLADLIDKRITG